MHGIGRAHSGSLGAVERKNSVERFLMSGKEAQDPRNLIKLFEQIKGRKATPAEVAEFERVRPAARTARR
jgi:hypothetical protein